MNVRVRQAKKFQKLNCYFASATSQRNGNSLELNYV